MDELFNFGNPSELVDIGNVALATGQVTPKQARKVQKELAKDPGDFLNTYLFGAQKNPYIFDGGKPEEPPSPEETVVVPQAPVPPMLAAAEPKMKEENAEGNVSKKTRTSHFDKQQFSELADIARSLPEIQSQSESLQGMKRELDMLANSKADDSDWWVKPLAGLADFRAGKGTLSSIMEDSSAATKRKEAILKYRDDIQKREQDMAKTILEGITKLKSGQDQEEVYKKLKEATGGLSDYQQERLNNQTDFRDRGEHEKVLGRLASNKGMKDRINQYQNLSNSLALVENAENLTPQQVDEFQQSVRSNLGIKGTGGVEERAKTFIDTLGLSAARWSQFLTGDPADIAKDSKLVKHIIDLAKVEQQNIKGQFGKMVDTAAKGHSSMYKRRPDLRSDLEEAMQAYTEAISAGAGSPSSGTEFDNMTNDELKQWIKDNGG